MVFAADDDRNGADTNGDGVALSFTYFAPMDTTNAQLTLDGQVHYMGSGVVQLEGAPVWEVTDDGARWLGEVPAPEGMVMADVTIDCAPREAAARGLTGRVSGNFGDIAVDAPLSCETWGSPKVELSTEEATRPRFQAFYVTQMNAGGLVVTTDERRFEVAAVGHHEDRIRGHARCAPFQPRDPGQADGRDDPRRSDIRLFQSVDFAPRSGGASGPGKRPRTFHEGPRERKHE